MIMLTSELIKRITQQLVAEFNPEKIILFGSHAWGQPDKNSDVDLGIEELKN